MLHECLVARLCLLEAFLDLLFCRLFHVFSVDGLNGDSFSQVELNVTLAVAGQTALLALIRIDLLVIDVPTRRTLHGILATVVTVAVTVVDMGSTPWARH